MSNIFSNIFISCRRQDATETATRLYEALESYFGRQPIFQDVENIPPGYDFAAYLRQTIPQCAVMLVVDPTGSLRPTRRVGVV